MLDQTLCESRERKRLKIFVVCLSHRFYTFPLHTHTERERENERERPKVELDSFIAVTSST